MDKNEIKYIIFFIMMFGLAATAGISFGIRDEEARARATKPEITDSMQDKMETALFLHQMKVLPF
jgi:hypothetical protein